MQRECDNVIRLTIERSKRLTDHKIILLDSHLEEIICVVLDDITDLDDLRDKLSVMRFDWSNDEQSAACG